MKKNITNLSKFLIVMIFCLLSVNIISAAVTTWNYTKTGATNQQGPFSNRAACQTNLDAFKKTSPLIATTECVSSVDIKTITTQTTETVPVQIEAKVNIPQNNSIYKMLAPIGNITHMDSSGSDACKKDPTCIPNDIGVYLNIIFKLGIGICAALAVIMLIINGVKYMGDESVFGKTKAKEQMFGAITGLLIAIGSWALLNTINPALTGNNGLNVSSANIEIVPLYDRGANDPKNANGESVRCTPVTNPTSPCTVEKLTPIFGATDAVAMSKICNMETGGTSVASGTDVCKPGNNAFSFGLFQVNLSSNGILAGADCVGLFNKAVVGSDAILPKYNSGFTCNLVPGKEALYSKCKAVLLDPVKNLAIAKKLYTPSKSAWLGDKKYCASAFK